MSDEPLMDTEDVARYLKVHVKTVMNLVNRGELIASKVGRHWRYRKRDVDAYLEQRQNRPRNESVLSDTRHEYEADTSK